MNQNTGNTGAEGAAAAASAPQLLLGAPVQSVIGRSPRRNLRTPQAPSQSRSLLTVNIQEPQQVRISASTNEASQSKHSIDLGDGLDARNMTGQSNHSLATIPVEGIPGVPGRASGEFLLASVPNALASPVRTPNSIPVQTPVGLSRCGTQPVLAFPGKPERSHTSAFENQRPPSGMSLSNMAPFYNQRSPMSGHERNQSSFRKQSSFNTLRWNNSALLPFSRHRGSVSEVQDGLLHQQFNKMQHLSPSDREFVKQEFEELDGVYNGALGAPAVALLWATIFPRDIVLKQKDVDKIWQDLDKEGKGCVTFGEVLEFFGVDKGDSDDGDSQAELEAVLPIQRIHRQPEDVREWLRALFDPDLARAYTKPHWLVKGSVRLMLAIYVVIAVSIVDMMIGSQYDLSDETKQLLFRVEVAVTIIFTMETTLRFVAAERKVKDYWLNPYTWIDIVAIVPFYLELFLLWFESGHGGMRSGFMGVRAVRFLRALKAVRAGRAVEGFQRRASSITGLSLRILLVALRKSASALAVWAAVLMIIILVFSVIIHNTETWHVEYDRNQSHWVLNGDLGGAAVDAPVGFRSIHEALWWAFTTFGAVGYGDVVPQTLGGKFVTGVAVFILIINMAIPLTIIQRNYTITWETYMRGKKERKELKARADKHSLAWQDDYYDNMHDEGFEYIDEADGRPATAEVEDVGDGDVARQRSGDMVLDTKLQGLGEQASSCSTHSDHSPHQLRTPPPGAPATSPAAHGSPLGLAKKMSRWHGSRVASPTPGMRTTGRSVYGTRPAQRKHSTTSGAALRAARFASGEPGGRPRGSVLGGDFRRQTDHIAELSEMIERFADQQHLQKLQDLTELHEELQKRWEKLQKHCAKLEEDKRTVGVHEQRAAHYKGKLEGFLKKTKDLERENAALRIQVLQAQQTFGRTQTVTHDIERARTHDSFTPTAGQDKNRLLAAPEARLTRRSHTGANLSAARRQAAQMQMQQLSPTPSPYGPRPPVPMQPSPKPPMPVSSLTTHLTTNPDDSPGIGLRQKSVNAISQGGSDFGQSDEDESNFASQKVDYRVVVLFDWLLLQRRQAAERAASPVDLAGSLSFLPRQVSRVTDEDVPTPADGPEGVCQFLDGVVDCLKAIFPEQVAKWRDQFRTPAHPHQTSVHSAESLAATAQLPEKESSSGEVAGGGGGAGKFGDGVGSALRLRDGAKVEFYNWEQMEQQVSSQPYLKVVEDLNTWPAINPEVPPYTEESDRWTYWEVSAIDSLCHNVQFIHDRHGDGFSIVVVAALHCYSVTLARDIIWARWGGQDRGGWLNVKRSESDNSRTEDSLECAWRGRDLQNIGGSLDGIFAIHRDSQLKPNRGARAGRDLHSLRSREAPAAENVSSFLRVIPPPEAQSTAQHRAYSFGLTLYASGPPGKDGVEYLARYENTEEDLMRDAVFWAQQPEVAFGCDVPTLQGDDSFNFQNRPSGDKPGIPWPNALTYVQGRPFDEPTCECGALTKSCQAGNEARSWTHRYKGTQNAFNDCEHSECNWQCYPIDDTDTRDLIVDCLQEKNQGKYVELHHLALMSILKKGSVVQKRGPDQRWYTKQEWACQAGRRFLNENWDKARTREDGLKPELFHRLFGMIRDTERPTPEMIADFASLQELYWYGRRLFVILSPLKHRQRVIADGVSNNYAPVWFTTTPFLRQPYHILNESMRNLHSRQDAITVRTGATAPKELCGTFQSPCVMRAVRDHTPDLSEVAVGLAKQYAKGDEGVFERIDCGRAVKIKWLNADKSESGRVTYTRSPLDPSRFEMVHMPTPGLTELHKADGDNKDSWSLVWDPVKTRWSTRESGTTKTLTFSENEAQLSIGTALLSAVRPLMFCIDFALNELPEKPKKERSYRGIGGVSLPKEMYCLNAVVLWASYSSTSRSQGIATKFSEGGKLSSVFSVEGTAWRDISIFSRFGRERELLYLPNTRFQIKALLTDEQRQILAASDFQLYELEQVSDYESLEIFIRETMSTVWNGDPDYGAFLEQLFRMTTELLKREKVEEETDNLSLAMRAAVQVQSPLLYKEAGALIIHEILSISKLDQDVQEKVQNELDESLLAALRPRPPAHGQHAPHASQTTHPRSDAAVPGRRNSDTRAPSAAMPRDREEATIPRSARVTPERTLAVASADALLRCGARPCRAKARDTQMTAMHFATYTLYLYDDAAAASAAAAANNSPQAPTKQKTNVSFAKHHFLSTGGKGEAPSPAEALAWRSPDGIGRRLARAAVRDRSGLGGLGIDATTKHGRTPLHCAAMWGNVDCVTVLLGAGADPGLRTKVPMFSADNSRAWESPPGLTPYDCAEWVRGSDHVVTKALNNALKRQHNPQLAVEQPRTPMIPVVTAVPTSRQEMVPPPEFGREFTTDPTTVELNRLMNPGERQPSGTGFNCSGLTVPTVMSGHRSPRAPRPPKSPLLIVKTTSSFGSGCGATGTRQPQPQFTTGSPHRGTTGDTGGAPCAAASLSLPEFACTEPPPVP